MSRKKTGDPACCRIPLIKTTLHRYRGSLDSHRVPMRWGMLLTLQASHSKGGLAHRVSVVCPELLLFRVDVLTSPAGQRVDHRLCL